MKQLPFKLHCEFSVEFQRWFKDSNSFMFRKKYTNGQLHFFMHFFIGALKLDREFSASLSFQFLTFYIGYLC